MQSRQQYRICHASFTHVDKIHISVLCRILAIKCQHYLALVQQELHTGGATDLLLDGWPTKGRICQHCRRARHALLY